MAEIRCQKTMKYKGNLSTKLFFSQKDEHALTTLLHSADDYDLLFQSFPIPKRLSQFCHLLLPKDTWIPKFYHHYYWLEHNKCFEQKNLKLQTFCKIYEILHIKEWIFLLLENSPPYTSQQKDPLFPMLCLVGPTSSSSGMSLPHVANWLDWQVWQKCGNM